VRNCCNGDGVLRGTRRARGYLKRFFFGASVQALESESNASIPDYIAYALWSKTTVAFVCDAEPPSTPLDWDILLAYPLPITYILSGDQRRRRACKPCRRDILALLLSP
jgi:hypothetical protein